MKIVLCIILISLVILVGLVVIFVTVNADIERHCNNCDKLEECTEMRNKGKGDICTVEYFNKLKEINKKNQ